MHDYFAGFILVSLHTECACGCIVKVIKSIRSHSGVSAAFSVFFIDLVRFVCEIDERFLVYHIVNN